MKEEGLDNSSIKIINIESKITTPEISAITIK